MQLSLKQAQIYKWYWDQKYKISKSNKLKKSQKSINNLYQGEMNGNSFFCNLPSVTMCTLIVADDLSEYALTTLKGIANNLWIV